MFKIWHIPSKKYVKKIGNVTWYSISCINNGHIEDALTSGKGVTFATEDGVYRFLNKINSEIREQFEVREFHYNG